MTLKYDFEKFPTLETPRLILREVTQHDAEAIFSFRSDYEVTRLNFGPPYTHIDEIRHMITRMQDGFEAKAHLRWGITLRGDDTVIGLVGFNYFDHQDKRAAVGFDLAKAYWGQGIMTEALSVVVDFGFHEAGLNRIEADCSILNVGSQRVLEKVGFVREGRQRQQYYYDGTFHDLLLWSVLRSEWVRR